MRIEGLHNQTGRWVEIAAEVDGEEEARAQIEQFASGGNSHLILWGTPTNTEHFSALRLAND